MSKEQAILPGSTIGLLGGGQLGFMLGLAARAMGYRVAVLDPDPDCPCRGLADHFVHSAFDSIEGARKLAAVSDVITYEFENVGAEQARILEQESCLPQGFDLLYQTRNRIREKAALGLAGVSVAPYAVIRMAGDLAPAAASLGYPVLLKIAEGGYDGKGQWIIENSESLHSVTSGLPDDRMYVLEKMVSFMAELSVIVARNRRGEVAVFPAARNVHRSNILHTSLTPAGVPLPTAQKAESVARTLAEHFSLVGLLAVELFVMPDGELLVNELAPRPHNSGHYTQQGCATSQFEQHIRAVCNLPLGPVELLRPTVMVNVLGEDLPHLLEKYDDLPPHWYVHLYGKKQARPGRKMGHINVAAPCIDQALSEIYSLGVWPRNPEEGKSK